VAIGVATLAARQAMAKSICLPRTFRYGQRPSFPRTATGVGQRPRAATITTPVSTAAGAGAADGQILKPRYRLDAMYRAGVFHRRADRYREDYGCGRFIATTVVLHKKVERVPHPRADHVIISLAKSRLGERGETSQLRAISCRLGRLPPARLRIHRSGTRRGQISFPLACLTGCRVNGPTGSSCGPPARCGKTLLAQQRRSRLVLRSTSRVRHVLDSTFSLVIADSFLTTSGAAQFGMVAVAW